MEGLVEHTYIGEGGGKIRLLREPWEGSLLTIYILNSLERKLGVRG